MARKNYSEEFRRDAVELYRVTEGATVAQIAADLGIAQRAGLDHREGGGGRGRFVVGGVISGIGAGDAHGDGAVSGAAATPAVGRVQGVQPDRRRNGDGVAGRGGGPIRGVADSGRFAEDLAACSR